jgi:two-component system sensor histidine kinase HydH
VGELSRSFETMVKNVAAAQNDLIQSSKLAFLGELAAGIAHDIRTPLGIIKNSAQLIERRAVLAHDDESREFARFIEDEADRLNASVNMLLDVARPAALHKTPCDLAQIVKRVVQFLRSEALAHKVELSALAAPGLPELDCDADQIYQALLNLVVNALQACEPGGRVEVGAVATDGGLEVVVSDTGHGISESIRENLFLPFVSEKAGGVGLGLAVVKRIVSAHAGWLDARNREAGGAQFRVWLPFAAAVAASEPVGDDR